MLPQHDHHDHCAHPTSYKSLSFAECGEQEAQGHAERDCQDDREHYEEQAGRDTRGGLSDTTGSPRIVNHPTIFPHSSQDGEGDGGGEVRGEGRKIYFRGSDVGPEIGS